MLKKYVKFLQMSLIMTLMSVTLTTHAQTCPTIVQDALAAMDNACRDTERNQACYGNGQIDLIPQPNITLAAFQTPGDQVAVSGIQTMTLYPLDETANTWGVALMRVQANLPDTVPGQNVTVLVFGDTEITNASQNMDAFYFRGGVGEAECAQAPNGIMIQTPEGAGMIDLTINDVSVSLGSTAFITAEVEEGFFLYLLEGEADVTAEGITQTLTGGEVVNIPLDENLSASDAPGDPQPIDFAILPILPISALETDISQDVPDLPLADNTQTTTNNQGEIIPRTGNWQYTTGDIITSSGCPAGFANIMTSSLPTLETSFVDFGGEPLDLPSLFQDAEDVGFVYDNPQPNIHTASFSEEGVDFTYQLEVVSETQLVGFFIIDVALPDIACAITLNFSVQLVE